jgi:TonB family protein
VAFLLSLGLHGIIASFLFFPQKEVSEQKPITIAVEWEKPPSHELMAHSLIGMRDDAPHSPQAATSPIRGEVNSKLALFPQRREPRKILQQTFPGSRILRKAKAPCIRQAFPSLREDKPKFQDDAAMGVAGEVATQGRVRGPYATSLPPSPTKERWNTRNNDDKVPSKKSYQPLPTYPWICRKRGQEGQVHLCIQTNEQGQVIKAILHKSSGYALLDQTALEAVTIWTFVEGSKQKLLSISFRLKG